MAAVKSPPTPAEIAQHLALLAATPQRIAAATAGLAEARLRASPAPKVWSAARILAHLRGCDDVWAHTVYAMLLHDDPVLPLLNPRDWAKIARYAVLDFRTSFQAFTLKRAEYLAVLRQLPPASWSRAARIQNHTHTVFTQVRRTALHEAIHCGEIEVVLRPK